MSDEYICYFYNIVNRRTRRSMEPSLHSVLSRRERQIMDVLYRTGDTSAAEIMKALPGGPPDSTVRSQLRVLERKGYVRHELQGRRYVFKPVLPRHVMRIRELKHLVGTFFDDSVEAVITTLLRGEVGRLSDRALEDISGIVDRFRKERLATVPPSVTAVNGQERCRLLWEATVQDLRLAIRTFRATPVVTVVAILSLALGIGANTAMFSIADSLLLRALPVERPERLALLVSNPPGGTTPAFSSWSNPVWEQIRDRRHELFQTAFAFSARTTRFNLASGGQTDLIDGLWASGDYFEALGVSPILGRTFTAESRGADLRTVKARGWSFQNGHSIQRV